MSICQPCNYLSKPWLIVPSDSSDGHSTEQVFSFLLLSFDLQFVQMPPGVPGSGEDI